MFLRSFRKTSQLRLVARSCQNIQHRSIYADTLAGIAPIAIDFWSSGLNALPSLTTIASIASDSAVSDTVSLTPGPEWFAWAPEVNSTVAGILGVVPVACLSFLLLSPLDVCRKVKEAKTVGSLKSAPFFAVANASMAWCAFGIKVQDWVIIAPNAMGLALSGYYLHTYSTNCEDPSALRPGFLVSGALAAGVTGAAVAFPEQSTQYIGYLTSALTIWLSVSPLTALKTLMEEKSTAALPFGISLGIVFNNLSWATYGVLVAHNPFLVFPNLVGLSAGLVQLSMFGFYGMPPPIVGAAPKKKEKSTAAE